MAPVSAAAVRNPTLFVLVDGISYRTMQELKREGKIFGFDKIAKVVSTYPSTTVSGITGILNPVGARPSEGYDHIFFSYARNRVQGTLLSALKENTDDYIQFFDYYRKTFWSNFMIYVFPGWSTKNDLVRIKNFVLKHPEREVFLFYIGGPDGSGHVLGEKRQKRLAAFILEWLWEIQLRYYDRFEIPLDVVVFSDHGFKFHPLKVITYSRLKRDLKSQGYELGDNLERPENVVVVEWGNISGAAFYTHPEATEAVAGVLSRVEGNDLTFYKEDDEIFVLSATGGKARIDVSRSGTCFRYVPMTGDPLGYQEVVDRLRSQGCLDGTGFAHKDAWFEATAWHTYPDVPYRVHAAFNSLVNNPATILISTGFCHEYGGGLTRFLSKLRGGLKGTHGGIFDAASDAFLAVSGQDVRLPAAMRYDEIWRYIPELKKLRRVAPGGENSKFQAPNSK